MQLIDKEVLLDKLNKKLEAAKDGDNGYYDGKVDAYDMAIMLTDETQVVEERKCGYWTKDGKCSCCGYPAATDTKLDYLDINDQLYCYNCGASMVQEF